MNHPKTLMIDNEKYILESSVKPQTFQPALEGDFVPWELGAAYLIRTVTMTNTGRVIAASHRYIVLEDAAWIASTGRFADALKKCQFNEIEPFPDGRVIIAVGAIVDAVKVEQVQRSQK